MLNKIFILFFTFVVLIVMWSIYSVPDFAKYSSDLEVYLFSPSSNAQIVHINTDLDSYYFYKVGESCVLEKDFDVEKLLYDLDAEIIFTETSQFVTSIYCFSPKLKYKKIINGEIINLHVAISESQIKIGSPIIYGSY